MLTLPTLQETFFACLFIKVVKLLRKIAFLDIYTNFFLLQSKKKIKSFKSKTLIIVFLSGLHFMGNLTKGIILVKTSLVILPCVSALTLPELGYSTRLKCSNHAKNVNNLCFVREV
jgi:hypothetical protein